jgi:drug/metabolite transporter (DMT)-like permease
MNKNILGAIFGLLGFFTYSVGDVIFKKLSEDYDTILSGFYNDVVVLINLIILAAIFRKPTALYKTTKIKLHLIRGAAYTAAFASFLLVVAHAPLATIYTVYFTSPFWALILAGFLLKEYVGIHRWGACIVGFTGILLALRPGIAILPPQLLFAIGGSVLFAIGHTASRMLGEKEHWLTLSFYCVVCTLITFGAYLLLTGSFALPRPGDLPWFIAVGLCCTCGVILISLAFSMADSSLVAPTYYTQLIWGALFGFIFFGDIMDDWTIAGAAIIVASGLYMIDRERKASASRAQ